MIRLRAIFLSALVLAAPVYAEKPPIKIGWSGPLTGNSAVLGIDSVEAARIAVDEANAAGGIAGRRLELVVEDDSYDTAKALSAYTKLVANDGVSGILMSTYGGVFATADRALKDGVIVINPLDCNNEIGALPENTFCVATESESIGRIIAENIAAEKLSPVGVIYDESNPFMVLVEKSLRARLGELGVNEIFSEGVSKDAADFKTVLLKYKTKNVKALVLFGHDPMGTAMSQARGIGIGAQFYTLGTITSPGYQKLAGSAANGTKVAYWEASRSKAFQSFIDKFKAKVGRPPILELATIPSYDSAKILIDAIRDSHATDGSIGLSETRKRLLSIKNYEGISGMLTMDPDGAVRSIREKIYRFDNEQLLADS